VVAAEHERQRAALAASADERGQPVAEIEDLGEIARVLVAHVGRLDDRRDDVARVGDPHAELLRELLLEARVADRGRAHVDAAPPAPRSSGAPITATSRSAFSTLTAERLTLSVEEPGYTDRRPAAAR
jgi:hypothetical protein